MTTFMFVAMIIGAVVGLLVAHSHHESPVFTGFHDEAGAITPHPVRHSLRAVSGFMFCFLRYFSKTVETKKDMLKVGYGTIRFRWLFWLPGTPVLPAC